tara:strand:- start:93 stop:380 length:288 start_codon:yes stop_codon:yes gene_type:complete
MELARIIGAMEIDMERIKEAIRRSEDGGFKLVTSLGLSIASHGGLRQYGISEDMESRAAELTESIFDRVETDYLTYLREMLDLETAMYETIIEYR